LEEYQVGQIYERLKELLLMEQDANVSNLAEQLGMTQSAIFRIQIRHLPK